MTTIQISIAAGAGKDSAGRRRKGSVSLLEIDLAAGSHRQIAALETIDHPSCLAWSGRRSVLYVAGERPEIDGLVTVVALRGSQLSVIGGRQTGGNGAVHLCLDRSGNTLFAANYQDSEPAEQVSVAVFPILTDGSLAPISGSASHHGYGKDPSRQDRPHCHGVAISPDNRLLAAVDLGTDSVYFYRFDAASGAIALATQLRLPAGCGPRHSAFHPSRPILYVTGELDSSLMTIAYEVDGAAARLLASEGASRHKGTERNYPSGIAISPDGHYVLAANRGADTIAVFFVDAQTGVARLRDEVGCGGDFPRAIRLDPTAHYLAVANQKSDNLAVFGWDFSTGTLTAKPIVEIDIPIPFDAVFIDA